MVGNDEDHIQVRRWRSRPVARRTDNVAIGALKAFLESQQFCNVGTEEESKINLRQDTRLFLLS